MADDQWVRKCTNCGWESDTKYPSKSAAEAFLATGFEGELAPRACPECDGTTFEGVPAD
jgi:hypothetical protein